MFDGIITFEIYLKSFLAHELSLFGGEFGYTKPEGSPELSFDDNLACINSLRASFTKSNLPYLKHFKRTYKDPLPPYWMIVGYLSIGTVCTPMNGGATIGTLSERTLLAPPLSSPWKTTCCNKSMAPHGRTNSSASWTAIRKFPQRKWDSPRIGDHSHCGHDGRRAPSVAPCPFDHDL